MANEKIKKTGQSGKSPETSAAGKPSSSVRGGQTSPEKKRQDTRTDEKKERKETGRPHAAARSANQVKEPIHATRQRSGTTSRRTPTKAAPSGAAGRENSGTGVHKQRKTGEYSHAAAQNVSARKEEGDAGYHPYRAANNRRKQRKTNSIRKFFSGQNPIIQRVTRYVDGIRDRDAMRKMTQKYQPHRADTPAVIYTQPKAFNRDRLLVQLLSILAVVAALVLGLSVFFKVKVITVSGAKVYSAWTVREASGISEGNNLLTFGRAKAAGKIIANLPYVKSARIGIKLPDTVNIEIVEENVVYSIESSDGVWWLMNSTGKVVEQTTATVAKTYTQVLGVTLANPTVGEIGTATEETAAQTDTTTDANGETEATVSVSLTGLQRLSAALEILQAMEDNDIVGKVASVDVTRLNDIILWYGTQYQVNLGDNTNLAYKIACMNDVILQLSDYQTGILDVSFTTWKQQVGYTPFE